MSFTLLLLSWLDEGGDHSTLFERRHAMTAAMERQKKVQVDVARSPRWANRACESRCGRRGPTFRHLGQPRM